MPYFVLGFIASTVPFSGVRAFFVLFSLFLYFRPPGVSQVAIWCLVSVGLMARIQLEYDMDESPSAPTASLFLLYMSVCVLHKIFMLKPWCSGRPFLVAYAHTRYRLVPTFDVGSLPGRLMSFAVELWRTTISPSHDVEIRLFRGYLSVRRFARYQDMFYLRLN